VLEKGFRNFGLERLDVINDLSPSGPIGVDKYGHLVVLDRTFKAKVDDLLSKFTDEEFIRHMAARREAMRAMTTLLCAKNQKRVYKAILVVDLDGLSFGHVAGSNGKRFMARLKASNGIFAWYYPESTFKVIVFNAPLIFQGLWKVAQQFVHPVTAAKVAIIGRDLTKVFSENGIVLDEGLSLDKGRLVGEPPTWEATLDKVKAQIPSDVSIIKGWMPPEDVAAVAGQPEPPTYAVDSDSQPSRYKPASV